VRTSAGQKKIKEPVGGARRLLHYYQLPDKMFVLYFEGDLEFLRYLKMFIYSKIPRETLFGKHYCTPKSSRCMQIDTLARDFKLTPLVE
jgi:hypothetical protein